MTPEQFTYWLQGLFELSEEGCAFTKREQMIKDHLKTVFDKRTPNYGNGGGAGHVPQTIPSYPNTPPNTYINPYPTAIC